MDTSDLVLAYEDETKCCVASCRKDEFDMLAMDPNFALKVAPCGHKLCVSCESLPSPLSLCPCSVAVKGGKGLQTR